jgi:hypothetical protein
MIDNNIDDNNYNDKEDEKENILLLNQRALIKSSRENQIAEKTNTNVIVITKEQKKYIFFIN